MSLDSCKLTSDVESTPDTTYVNDSLSPSGLSPLNAKETVLPNNFKYYSHHLNKGQFNLILINCSINLVKVLYPEMDESKIKLRFFMVEILRRSKTSIQSLQITCFYLLKLIQRGKGDLLSCPKKLFLGLLIIASKFNQDANYSFKTWLKICGCNNGTDANAKSDLNLQILRNLEVTCLGLLDYECYINNSKYENWCNILLIFGYDFIKFHKIYNNEIVWEADLEVIAHKLVKWKKFLINLDISKLNVIKSSFSDYYISQYGKKVLLYDDANIPSLFDTRKRKFMDDNFGSIEKKFKVSCK